MACCSRTLALHRLRISQLLKLDRCARLGTRAASFSTAAAEPTEDAAASTPPTSSANSYPFSSAALVRSLPPTSTGDLTPLARGSQPKSIYKGVLPRVHQALRAQLDPDQSRTSLVDRRSAEQIPPGSVLTIETWTSTAQRGSSSFSGVLIAIRRRGLATSLVLRTLVANKLGVEMRFSLYSPLIKEIKVVARAEAHKRQQGLRRTRRAKLYYLRRDERRLTAVAGLVKAQRQAEELAQLQAEEKAAGKTGTARAAGQAPIRGGNKAQQRKGKKR
ncbi:hypothetical protein OC845_001718 [Tilletia horrida]|nr:hypothetical protein OC845_001718 [Tilletia horrida]